MRRNSRLLKLWRSRFSNTSKRPTRAEPTHSKRFEALTVEDVRAEAAAKYSGKSIFTLEDKNRHAELTSKLDILKRRLNRWQGDVLCVTNVPGPPNGPDIAPSRVLIRGDYRQPGEVVEPGFPTAITGKERTRCAGNRPLPAVRHARPPYHAGALDCFHGQSADGSSMGESLVAASFRAGDHSDCIGFRSEWRPAFAPGVAGHAGGPVHGVGLGYEGDAQADADLGDVPAGRGKSCCERNFVDPENRLLWKFNRRRLEAEAIRDGILQVSGRLNPERGGPSVFPPLPADLADFARYGRTGGLMWEPNEKDEDARRRSIYIFQRRSLPLPMMAAFDAPVFSESCERRSSTTTPLQALSMLNGYLVNEEAEHLHGAT